MSELQSMIFVLNTERRWLYGGGGQKHGGLRKNQITVGSRLFFESYDEFITNSLCDFLLNFIFCQPSVMFVILPFSKCFLFHTLNVHETNAFSMSL